MSVSEKGPDALDTVDPVLDRLVEELTRKVQAGEPVDLGAIAREHPAHAGRLRQLLPALEMLADLGQPVGAEGPQVGAPAPELGVLGDFRLVREVGRGGMGVVYEAEQISLRRRVALKILPFAATLDSRQIQRFQLEAQAAACLHHPHIVPVHGVGCERGVHYYAMQLIDGQSLAVMIAELRRLDPAEDRVPGLSAVSTTTLAARLISGGEPDRPAGVGSEGPAVALPGGRNGPGPPAIEAPPIGRARPARSSTHSRDYVRAAARLALQAAEALDHAHSRGVLHRDIKPGNLLLDPEGRLWVTDFGLAQVRGDDRLTLSGDIMGTLRYMSPEQALGRHVVVDGRTDIYSLGVTLYELLTLHPAFDGRDRAEVLRRIADLEPTPPRCHNRAVPADLETIVLKATDKDPAARYATAGELADDLRRFLEDRPVRARRPSLADRAAKWSRRHTAVVASAAILVILTVLGLAVSSVLIARERDRAEGRSRLARRAVDEMYTRFNNDVLSVQSEFKPVHLHFLEQAQGFYQEFARDRGNGLETRYGVAAAHLELGLIQRRLGREAESRAALRLAVDHSTRLVADFPGVPKCRALSARSYNSLGNALTEPTEQEAAYRQSLALWESLADDPSSRNEALRGQTKAYYNLAGLYLSLRRLPEAEQSIRLCMARTAERHSQYPDSLTDSPPYFQSVEVQARRRPEVAGDTANLLGAILHANGRHQEAERAYRVAIAAIDDEEATFAAAGHPLVGYVRLVRWQLHHNLEWLLIDTGRTEEAEEVFRRLFALSESMAAERPGDPRFPQIMAWRLATHPVPQGRDPTRAVELARRAVEKAKAEERYRTTLGVAYYRAGDWKAAAEELETGMRLGKGGDAGDWLFLAMCHWQLGDRDQARTWYDRAVAWMDRNRPRNIEMKRFRAEAAALLGPGDLPADVFARP